MWSYKEGKAQKKALKKEQERDSRAARIREKDSCIAARAGNRRRRGTPPSAALFLPSGENCVCAAGHTCPRVQRFGGSQKFSRGSTFFKPQGGSQNVSLGGGWGGAKPKKNFGRQKARFCCFWRQIRRGGSVLHKFSALGRRRFSAWVGGW